MDIELACRVAKGARETNDDRALLLGIICDDEVVSGVTTLPAVAIVCDGCGGYDGGSIAASVVLESLRDIMPKDLMDPVVLAQTLERAEKRIAERKLKYPAYSHMCTTVVGCIFGEDQTLIFHSGDSRLYRFDGVFLAPMTIDHSAVRALVDCGKITEEEALTHPQRNIITRCMGTGGLPPEIYLSHSAICPGDIYILCSDGLWEYVSNNRMIEILCDSADLSTAAKKLVEVAIENGGDDNITVILCALKNCGEPVPEDAKTKLFTLD